MATAAVKKAGENPGASVFVAVLVGAVLLQGFKNLPDFGEWLWNKAIPFDVTAPVDYTYKAIKTTAALNKEVYSGFEKISAEKQDPLENFIWGDDVEGVFAPGEVGTMRKAYRGARRGLFTGLFNRGWNY